VLNQTLWDANPVAGEYQHIVLLDNPP